MIANLLTLVDMVAILWSLYGAFRVFVIVAGSGLIVGGATITRWSLPASDAPGRVAMRKAVADAIPTIAGQAAAVAVVHPPALVWLAARWWWGAL